jgi:ABC-type antimicrobial peptide transport system permease subunit
LYGVIAFGVAQRMRELAIRSALGARPADLRRLVFEQGLLLIVPGLLIGMAATFAFTRALASQLYGVGAGDPATLAFVSIALVIIALAACVSPARRATRTDPVRAMRGS